jgi:hypothetical protein
MKFGFKFGKNKEKAAVEEDPLEEEVGVEIVDQLIQSVEDGDETVRPHPPIQELSLDGEQELDETEVPLTEGPVAETGAESVKLVEVKAPVSAAAPASAPAPEAKKEEAGKPGEPLDISASINSIFTEVEEEENPLANLIKTLPDVAATELMDDLKEINDIMKDWKKH